MDTGRSRWGFIADALLKDGEAKPGESQCRLFLACGLPAEEFVQLVAFGSSGDGALQNIGQMGSADRNR
jgi:hypothetical protein